MKKEYWFLAGIVVGIPLSMYAIGKVVPKLQGAVQGLAGTQTPAESSAEQTETATESTGFDGEAVHMAGSQSWKQDGKCYQKNVATGQWHQVAC